MVEHHRQVADGAVPVRRSDDAWEMRRREYLGWLEDGTGSLLVARRDDGGLDGYAFLRVLGSGPTFDFGDVRGEVESLAVVPDARGKGIGSALVEASREHLRAAGCRYWTVSVMEENATAVHVYERAGFSPWLRHLAAPL
jgi:ribosomal protein S18 acetylase RimI-like enzyme